MLTMLARMIEHRSKDLKWPAGHEDCKNLLRNRGKKKKSNCLVETRTKFLQYLELLFSLCLHNMND